MSRSRKRHPYSSPVVFHAESNKRDKQRANRKLRRTVTRARLFELDDLAELPLAREVSNIYDWGSDGKRRFDPLIDPWVLRK